MATAKHRRSQCNVEVGLVEAGRASNNNPLVDALTDVFGKVAHAVEWIFLSAAVRAIGKGYSGMN